MYMFDLKFPSMSYQLSIRNTVGMIMDRLVGTGLQALQEECTALYPLGQFADGQFQ